MCFEFIIVGSEQILFENFLMFYSRVFFHFIYLLPPNAEDEL